MESTFRTPEQLHCGADSLQLNLCFSLIASISEVQVLLARSIAAMLIGRGLSFILKLRRFGETVLDSRLPVSLLLLLEG